MENQIELLPTTFPKEAYQYGQRSDGEVHGVVLTKPHIVDLILDLSGYKVGKDLPNKRLLEPSCGHGVFLIQAVKRLMKSLKLSSLPLESTKDSITSFDIDAKHVEITRKALADIVASHGYPKAEAKELAKGWVHEGDFLLAALSPVFDCIIGNPPYIRIEQISPQLQTEYRRRYASLYDRADLYVAFIERSLALLSNKGMLSFICADRWILNKYGAPLRKKVSNGFKVHSYIDLHQASPFDSNVIAYPSIFLVSRGVTEQVHVLSMKAASKEDCDAVTTALAGKSPSTDISYALYDRWFEGDEPWTLGSPEQLLALRDLEARFDELEADGTTKVKIGVATGSDKVYVVPKNAPIEKSRLLPLVMRADLRQGQIENAGRCVINTFKNEGGVVDLADYPKLKKYIEEHSTELKKRHVSKKGGAGWFRTIDRVYPELVTRPKLLIPDIAGSNEVTLDSGNYYPHHNLYFIVSDSWDLEVLGGLLSSRVALFFVWSYAVKMRGGYLRFQAQYIRRIRLPKPETLSRELTNDIRHAFRKRDFKELDELALKAFGLKKLPTFDFVDTRR
ncbi:Eco57I restriction-modification methylase domain-containing protein [Bdellovibrio sp. HCB117]|uniref:Eco57I restriction-modification methylase domain-containing protein n=1 Tax=Bdellovibrio sp. HCB117 TaxID=3394359 RepID=UPI0039B5FB2D